MAILDQAKPAESATAETYLIKCLLLGKSGSGKTTSAGMTLPPPVLVIDYDNRAESLAGVPGVEIIKLLPDAADAARWKKVEELTEELWSAVRKKTLKYKSILESGLTSMNRMSMYWALLLDPKRGLGGSPAKQHYPPQMKTLQDHILRMLGLPLNYVLEGHYNLFDDEETGGTTYLPLLHGKATRSELAGMFNECYHSYHTTDTKEKTERYFWHTKGFGKFDFMKSSLNQLGKFWTDPIDIDLTKNPAGFQKLLALRFGEKKG